MNRRMDRAVCLLAGYCFTIGLAAAGLATVVHAQEVVPSPPPGYACQGECALSAPLGIDPVAEQFFERATRALTTEFGSGVRFRVTMQQPALFTEKACDGLGCASNGGGCASSGGCGEDQAHCAVGIIASGPAPGQVFRAKFVRLGCPCSASGECKCGNDTADGKATCQCCPCAAASHETVAHQTKCGEETCEVTEKVVRLHHDEAFAAFAPHKLMQQIAQLMAERSAAQTALAVRTEADEQIGEIYEAMAELLADNAALDAKLEAQEESRQLAEKVAELAAENARLKTHIELAAERAELSRATAALQLENEKLKLHLATIEQKHALAEAARTAAKPRSERKAR